MPARSDALPTWLAGLDGAQIAAVRAPGSPVCVIAGAGSGKTRVLSARIAARIADSTADPAHCLALTFTRNAASELRARLAAMLGPTTGGRAGVPPVDAGTFHAIALSQLRQWWSDNSVTPPAFADPGRILSRLGVTDSDKARMTTEIAWASAGMMSADDYRAAAPERGRCDAATAERTAEVIDAYGTEKKRRHVIDFDDALRLFITTMNEEPRFAAAQRWRFRHFFVDEYQDLNPLQFRSLRAWLGEGSDLFVVGDPLQAIYSWNGSDPRLIARFAVHFPGAQIMTLATNYRCSASIVRAASAHVAASLPGYVHPVSPPAHRFGLVDAPPRIHGLTTTGQEAGAIVSILRAAHARGVPWESMAVLARTNARADSIAPTLRSSAVPYTMIGPDGSSADEQGVTVATFHRAKGLQWHTVVVAGLEDGVVPHSASESDPESADEEARLLYVAITRAARELHLSWAARRGNSSPVTDRSRYLDAIESSQATEIPTPDADQPSALSRLRETRRALHI